MTAAGLGRGLHLQGVWRRRGAWEPPAIVAAIIVFGGRASAQEAPRPSDSVAIDPSAFHVPRGPRANIDGNFTPGEWASADSLSFSFQTRVGDTLHVTAWLQHSRSDLEVAIVVEAPDGVSLAPELFLDTGNDRSPSLQPDDFWFHMSASDCTAVGRFDDYSNCAKKSWWESAPPPRARLGRMVRVFEMRIPLGRISLEEGSKFGLAFRMTHAVQVSGEWIGGKRFWPTEGSPERPSTWRLAQLIP